VPEFHRSADVVTAAAATDVVPDAGHDVLWRDVRLVEHAEPQPVRERPPEPRVVLAGGQYGGHADGPGRHVRVDGQRDPVAAGRHVERRAPGPAVRERQPPERFHAPIVDERLQRAAVAVRRGRREHRAVVRVDLSQPAGVVRLPVSRRPLARRKQSNHVAYIFRADTPVCSAGNVAQPLIIRSDCCSFTTVPAMSCSANAIFSVISRVPYG